MKDKKEFESFNESKKSPEVFSFSEKNNEKQFLNEDFVFKFEENKEQTSTPIDNEQTGHEVNHDDCDLGLKAEEALSQEDVQKIAEESATTTAATGSSTIATIATVATTSVVLVVGGGLAIYGQTVERPTICELNEVVAVDNNIKFTLAIGNTEEESMSTEGGAECDVVVELLCPATPEFVNTFEVKHFGQISGEFNDLSFDTEYTVNVYQNTFLDLNRNYLLESPFIVSTGASTPEVSPTPTITPLPEEYLTIEAEYDPFGNSIYYATITTKQDLSTYDYIYFGLRTEPLETGEDLPPSQGGDGPYIAMSSSFDINSDRQRLDFGAFDTSLDYFVDLVVEVEIGNEETGSHWDRLALLTAEVNFSTLSPKEYEHENKVSFMRTDSISSTSYSVYVDVVDELLPEISLEGGLYNPYKANNLQKEWMLTVHDINEEEGKDETIMSMYFRSFREASDFPIEFENGHSVYDDYVVVIEEIVIETQETTELYRQNVNFNYDCPVTYIPGVDTLSYEVLYSSFSSNAALSFYPFDPMEELSDWQIHIPAISEQFEQDEHSYNILDDGFGHKIVDGLYPYDEVVYYQVELTAMYKNERHVFYTIEEFDPSSASSTRYDGSLSISIGGENSDYTCAINTGDHYSYQIWRLEFRSVNNPDIVVTQSVNATEESLEAIELTCLKDQSEYLWEVYTYAIYDPEYSEEELVFKEVIDFSEIH